MPTWAMHLLTSKKVSKKINIDSNLFAFGNVLPDIPNGFVVENIRNYIPHSKSHFETEVLVLEHIEKRYDLRTFAEKYKTKFSNPLMLGYYIHLLTDYYWNAKTYDEHGIYNQEKKRVGLILNDGKRIMCSKETARQTKTADFALFSNYIYENKLVDELKFNPKIEKYLKDIDWLKLDEDEIMMTINYIMDRYTGKEKILKDEDKDKFSYKIYTEKEISEGIDDCVSFLLKMIRKHAKYLLKE